MPSIVPFSELPSRTPLHPRRTAERLDPYWDSLWRPGSTADWASRSDVQRLVSAGVVKVPASVSQRVSVATERVLDPRNREKVMRMIAAAQQWRTMTTEQLEAITDVTGIGSGSNPWWVSLWVAEVFERAGIQMPLMRGARGSVADLVRPGRIGDVLREFEAGLTWPEWVSVTAGIPMDNDRQYTRHNVLATELGLRVAEFGDVAMVLGEKLSRMDLLAYSGWGIDPPVDVASDSDLTIVRPDGLRIAVEVTASKVGPWFANKVAKLLTILHRRPLHESGLGLLFVVAPHQDATQAEVTESLRSVKKYVQHAVEVFPGTTTDPTALRVGVASWQHWFPSRGMVAADFARLPVERPTGLLSRASTEEAVWESAHLLDIDYRPADPEAATAVIRNAQGLRGVPHFLRGGASTPALWKQSMEENRLTPPPSERAQRGIALPSVPLRRLRY